MRRSFIFAAGMLALGACATDTQNTDEWTVAEGVGPIDKEAVIYYGSSPDEPYHDAVVSLHYRSGSTVYRSPFCTGTLVGDDVVMSAGHCLDVASGGSSSFSTMSPSNLAIYFGDRVTASDFTSHLYTVTDTEIYSGYNRRTIVNDISLIRLSSSPTEADPVPPLPESRELTSADEGINLNFAGFGVTHTGGYGTKMQVDLPMEGLGCVVSPYCSTTRYADTQFSYAQDDGGPCSGDSGGPAFINRGSTTYVAGITSYGDYYCEYYGVSTKVDAFESFWGAWVDGGDTGGTGDGGATGPYCGDGTCDSDESCDGRGGSGVEACPEDCDGRTTGPRFLQYCYIGDRCVGRGC